MREFHSYDEMSKDDFRALQLKELEILVYFAKFCEDHGLRFFLAGGTLLGAIRHKGFIPWDDDIDVFMPRPDYRKLPELWEKFARTEKYVLCMTTETENYRHHAFSISDVDTTMIEKRNIHDDIVLGIKIDVIPLDAAPKDAFAQKIQLFWAVLYAIYNVQRMPENQGGFLMRNIIRLMLAAVPSLHYRYKIWKFAEKKMCKYNFETAPYFKELIASFRTMHCLYPKDDFDKPVMVDFEGHQFPAFHYYVMYLKNAYGNYMQLPPEDKRVPKGNIAYINLDEGYKKFKGQYYAI